MTQNCYEELLEQLEKQGRAALVTTLDKPKAVSRTGLPSSFPEQIRKEVVVPSAIFEDIPPHIQEAFTKGTPTVVETEAEIIITEPFAREERMIILGGGHVSVSVAEFASKVGFQVTVVDDRLSFANKERFPMAEKVICDSFEHAIPSLGITEMDYIVLVTRGHRYDRECLEAIYEETGKSISYAGNAVSSDPEEALMPPTRMPLKYLGMIGSRRRVAGLKDLLVEEGIPRAWLDEIYTPIGLNIGAVTPEEIAIAIVAEVIQCKRKPQKPNAILHSDVEMDIIHRISQPSTLKRAIVTIISTKGSAPRKGGAKMIVYEDGSIEGSVGGGCAEAGVIRTALRILRTGGYTIERVDLTNEAAADEGMVCGGTADMLIEAIL